MRSNSSGVSMPSAPRSAMTARIDEPIHTRPLTESIPAVRPA